MYIQSRETDWGLPQCDEFLVKPDFVPDVGDFVRLTFDARTGHEQAGRRPALVLSPKAYNARSGLMLACTVTNQAKGYPFEVAVGAGAGVTGVILVEHLKSVDWKARSAERLGHCTDDTMEEVRARLAPLLGF
jgi:mRNA interferase MazF